MATINTNVQILATAQSQATWGRALSTEESAALRAKRGSMWSQGKFQARVPSETGTFAYAWETLDAAAEYVAYCNTFTPPPASATASALPEPTEPTESV
jgi:hypothetical protein